MLDLFATVMNRMEIRNVPCDSRIKIVSPRIVLDEAVSTSKSGLDGLFHGGNGHADGDGVADHDDRIGVLLVCHGFHKEGFCPFLLRARKLREVKLGQALFVEKGDFVAMGGTECR